MAWIERGSRQGDYTGVIRLAMPELLGTHYIIPKLADFIRRNDGIQFEFSADVRSAKLTKGEADILVRLTRPDHGSYHVKRIGRIALGLFASPDYVATFGTVTMPAVHSQHRFVGWDSDLSYLPISNWLDEKVAPQLINVRTRTMSSQFAVARAGIGIALLPALPAREAGLVPISTERFSCDVWMLLLDDIRNLKRFRDLADQLESFFRDDSADLVRMT